MATKQLDVKFEVKDISTEEGTFVGFASVYNVEDLGGDIVEKGAFTRTINARPSVPILWKHDEPIGVGTVEDGDHGLIVRGKLTLAVQKAREALALMKDGAVKGLSIGYSSVKDDIKGGVRHLREVKLWEVSVVAVPMNQDALIAVVKELPTESKEGRTTSRATRTRLEAVMAGHRAALDELQALLDETTIVDLPEPAVSKSADPIQDHSELSSLLHTLTGVFTSGKS